MKQTILAKSVDDSGTSTAPNTGFDLDAFKKKYGAGTGTVSGTGANGSGAFDLEAFRQKYSAIGKSSPITERDMGILEANRSGGDRYANYNGGKATPAALTSSGSSHIGGFGNSDTTASVDAKPVTATVAAKDYSGVRAGEARAERAIAGNEAKERSVTQGDISASRDAAAAADQKKLDTAETLSSYDTQLTLTPGLQNNPNFMQQYTKAKKNALIADTEANTARDVYNENKSAYWTAYISAQYDGLSAEPDYKQYSAARTGTNDERYNYINNVNNSRKTMEGKVESAIIGDPYRDYQAYAYMTAGEIANYNYLYSKRGAYAANQYLNDALMPELNKRRAKQKASETRAQASQNTGSAIGTSLLSVPANLTSGIGYVDLALQSFAANIEGKGRPVDFNNEFTDASRYASTVRETVANEITNVSGDSKVGKAAAKVAAFLYQTGMSMLDSTATAGLSALGLPVAAALLGGSAATQAALETIDNGGTQSQALLYGLAAGAAETIFEEVSLEKLFSLKTPESWKQVLKNMGIQAFTEGSEEVATTLANTLSDAAINRDNSELNRNIREYEKTMSHEEAVKAAWKDWFKGVFLDFLGGAVSGGLMGGGKSAVGYAIGSTEQKHNAAVQDALRASAKIRDQLAAQQAEQNLRNNAATVSAQVTAQEAIQRLAEQADTIAAKLKESQQNGTQAADTRLTLPTGEEGRTAQNVAAEATQQNAAITQQNAENAAPTQTRVAAAEQAAYTGTQTQRQTVEAENGSNTASGLRGVVSDLASAAQRSRQQDSAAAQREVATAIRARQQEAAQQQQQRVYAVVTAAKESTGERPTTAEIRALYASPELVQVLTDAGLLTAEQVQTQNAAAMWMALNTEQKGMTENGGDTQAQTADSGAGTDTVLHRDGGRKNGLGGRIARFTRNYKDVRAERQQQSRSAVLRYAETARTEEARTSDSLGIRNGSRNDTVRVVPDSLLDEEFVRVRDEYAAAGITVTPVSGFMHTGNSNGTINTVRGVFQGNHIWVMMDHRSLSWQSILEHEDFHRQVKQDSGLLDYAYEALLRDLNPEEIRQVLRSYSECYMPYGVEGNDVLEEMLADFYAGIDIFNKSDRIQMNISEKRQTVQRAASEREGKNGGETQGKVQKYNREIEDDGRENGRRRNQETGRSTNANIYAGEARRSNNEDGRRTSEGGTRNSKNEERTPAFRELKEKDKNRISAILLSPLSRTRKADQFLKQFTTTDEAANWLYDRISDSMVVSDINFLFSGFSEAANTVLEYFNYDDFGAFSETTPQNAFSDRNGAPKTFYHGGSSLNDIDLYLGVWLTEDKSYAKDFGFADNGVMQEFRAGGEKTAELGDIQGDLTSGTISRLANAIGVTESELKRMAAGHVENEHAAFDLTRSRAFIEAAKENGYDSFHAYERGGVETYCVFGNKEQLQPVREGEATKFSTQMGKALTFSEAELNAIQGVGRKSVYDFNSSDIQATERLAKRYREEMKEKSPFFRAWFGEWRENDKTAVKTANRRGNTRGIHINKDTGWEIRISGKVKTETTAHSQSFNIAARPYLEYLDDIVENAVLLDTFGIGEAKSANSLLMHNLFAVADIGNGKELIKLYVEEMNDPNITGTAKRAYQLQNIEKYQPTARSSQNVSSVSSAAGIKSISELVDYVKRKDAAYNPGKPSVVVNKNGEPKVVYHGTPHGGFTVFDHAKSGKRGSFASSRLGMFFTDDPQYARGFSHSGGTEADIENGFPDAQVYAAYLDIKKPLCIPSLELFTEEDVADVEWLLNNGDYDGIIDDAGQYVVFDPTQVKSATDNIGTYDKKNNDIRYSTEMDARYLELAKDPEGNREELQRMVEEAAKEAGYTVKAYHGTPNGTFHVFRDWSYFTKSKNYAERYTQQGASTNYKKEANKSTIYEVYIKVNKPFDTRKAKERNIFLKEFYRQWGNGAPLGNKGLPDWTDGDDFIEFFDENGYDYDEILLDEGGDGGYGDSVTDRGISYVVKNSAQVKSADPVTYDDNGNIIPLSQRFDSSKDDIRYSTELDEDIISLRKQNEALLKKVEYWKNQTTLTKTAPKLRSGDVWKLTNRLLNAYESTAAKNEIRDELQSLGDYILNDVGRYFVTENREAAEAYTDIKDRAMRIASKIVDNASVLANAEQQEEYKAVKSAVRSAKIEFTQRGDITDWNDFRKRNFGRFNIVNEGGTPIDTLWNEWQDSYGSYYFPQDIQNPTDMLVHLESMLGGFAEVYENPFSANLADAAEFVANDILDSLVSDSVREEAPTATDKWRNKVDEAKAEGRRSTEAARAEEQRKRAEQVSALKEANRQRVERLLNQEKEKREALAERYKAKEEKGRESRKASALRGKIQNHVTELTGKLLNPSDKRHIPQQFQKPAAMLLSAINLESGYLLVPDANNKSGFRQVKRGLELDGSRETERTTAFRELRDRIREISGELVIDPDLFGNSEQPGLFERVLNMASTPIANMNSAQLKDIYDAVRAIEAAVSSADRIFAAGKFQRVSEAANAIRQDNQKKIGKLELPGIGRGLQRLVSLDMLTPETYFRMLGGSGNAIFRMLRDAQDEFTTITKKAQDFSRKLTDGVDIRKLETDTHQVTLGGETHRVSTAQLMELYALMRREHGLQHITTGGIVLENKAGEKKRQTAPEPIHATIPELLDAVKLLGEHTHLIEEMQRYLSEDMAEEQNKSSMEVYNYKKFGEKNYWKIRSNKTEINSSIEKDTQTTSVANMGHTKATKPKADTAVLIGSAFDSFAASINDGAKYAAYLAVTEDVNRIRNYQFRDGDNQRTGTVKGYINRVHGQGGAGYLQNLLADISNGTGSDMSFSGSLFGKYKAAAVGANLRVVIQQPTAILRALDMIGPKYMTFSSKRVMQGWEKAVKYAPIAQWKDWGYFDINTGRALKDVLFENTSRMGKITEGSMWLAGKADSVAWGLLWNACEAEYKAQHGGAIDNEAIAKRFTEIVDHTQVVDGILQRSQIMRSDNAWDKLSTSFMGEPTKQYNMLYAAAYEAKTGSKDAVKRLVRTAGAFAVSNILNAAVQSIADGLRDDDKEKKYWEKWMNAMFGDYSGGNSKVMEALGSNLGSAFNPLTYIARVKDVWSIIQGFTVERMDMEGIDDVVNAAKRLITYAKGESKYTAAHVINDFLKAVGTMTGIPLRNLERDIMAAVDTIAIESDNYLLQYELEKLTYSVSDEKNFSTFAKILYYAYKSGDGSYDILLSKMQNDGLDVSELQKKVQEYMKNDIGGTAISEYAAPKATSELADSVIDRLNLDEGDYLPRGLNGFLTDGDGTDRQLTSEQYSEMQGNYLKMYWDTVDKLLSSSNSDTLNAAILKYAKTLGKAYAVDQALKAAGYADTGESGEYDGVSFDKAVLFNALVSLTDDDDGSTTQDEVIGVIQSMNLSKKESCILFRTRYKSDKNNPWAEPGNLLSASSGLLLPSE